MAHRIQKVNQLIRKELSELLQHQMKDPRLSGFISVNEVNASSDLKYAKVFVSCFGDDVEKKEVLAVLNAAAGFLRGELGRRLNLRHAPELNFAWDNSIEQGVHLVNMIDQVVEGGERD